MKDTHFNIVDDWGSFEAEPSYDNDNMVAVGLYTSDYLSDGYIPVHMDNASELADYLDDQREKMETATAELWKMMAGWSREQMIDAGLLVYYGDAQGRRPLRRRLRAGRLVPDRRAHPALQAADERRVRQPRSIARAGRADLADARRTAASTTWPGTRARPARCGRRSRTRCSPTTSGPPASVRSARGSTSLPAKTAKWTTTQGKLTQDECNERARAFTRLDAADGLVHLDDDAAEAPPGRPAGAGGRTAAPNSTRRC